MLDSDTSPYREPLRFAWLIAAHDKPDQLDYLLARLLPPGTTDFAVVHADAKSALWREHRARLANHPSGRVILVARPARVYWGHGSQLKATALLLREALKHRFDYAHFISGADWPVVSRSRIVADILADRKGRAYLTLVGAEQTERMMKWWVNPEPLVHWIPHKGLKAIVRYRLALVERAFGRWWDRRGLQRSQPFGSPWLKGWSWFSFPRDIAEQACAVLANRSLSRRVAFTLCSDEHFLATWLARTHADRIADYRRHIRWHENANNPTILTRDDLEPIGCGNAWFARKFDIAVDDFFLTAFPPFA